LPHLHPHSGDEAGRRECSGPLVSLATTPTRLLSGGPFTPPQGRRAPVMRPIRERGRTVPVRRRNGRVYSRPLSSGERGLIGSVQQTCLEDGVDAPRPRGPCRRRCNRRSERRDERQTSKKKETARVPCDPKPEHVRLGWWSLR
jgi:hypothetical protein